jgi:hypothetical protein
VNSQAQAGQRKSVEASESSFASQGPTLSRATILGTPSLANISPDDTVVFQTQFMHANCVFVFSCDMAIGEVQDQPTAIMAGKAKDIMASSFEHTSIVEDNRVMESSSHRPEETFVAREEFQHGNAPGPLVDPFALD